MSMNYENDPTSKSDFLDRLLSQAFTGDLREIAADPRKVQIERVKPHVVAVKVGGREFLLAVHKPKPEETRRRLKQKYRERVTGGGQTPRVHQAEEPKGGLGRYGRGH